MLLRQSPAQSRQPCRPVLRPRDSPASSELEPHSPTRVSPSLRAPLYDMYPEESRGSGGVATVDFLEGSYDYAAPTPAPTPLYSHSTTGCYSAPLDAHGPPSDGSLQSLGSGTTSPLVFVPSSPRLSPFMHPPSHHYLETTSTPVYRWGNAVFFSGGEKWQEKSEWNYYPLLTHLIICLAMAHPGLGFDCLAVVFVQKFGDYASVTW